VLTASTEYKQALRFSHEARLRVTLYDAGGLVGVLPVTDVSLVIDGNAAVRRTGTLTVAIDPWGTTSREVVEQINVQAGHVVIEHGIAWPGDPADWVQLARMRIGDTKKSVPGSSRTLELFDMALLVQEYDFPTPWAMYTSGDPDDPRPYIDLIGDALDQAITGAVLIVDPTIDTTIKPAKGQSFSMGQDRLDAIITMAEALDADFYNDTDGNFVLADATPDTSSVWQVDVGPKGVLIGMDETFSRQEQYNAVVMTFSAPDQPDSYAIQWDEDPASPTWFDGPFGRRPIFLAETYAHIPSKAKADAITQRRLERYLGATRALSLKTLYNPLLQPGDRIDVTWPDGEAEKQVIDKIALQLAPSSTSMQIDTRLDRL